MKGWMWAPVLAVLLCGCAAAESTGNEGAIASVGSREIAAWQYDIWVDRHLQALKTEPTEEEAAALKAAALADAALYAAVEEMAAEYGLAEEMLHFDEETQGYFSAVEELYCRLCAMEVPSETLAVFAEEEGYRTVDRILIPAGEGAADEAAAVFARLNGAGAEEFYKLKSEKGQTSAAVTLRGGEGVLPLQAEQAALALRPLQLSGIVETEEGFSVFYCLETDLAQIRMPWVDAQLLRRVAEYEVNAGEDYEATDICARFRSIRASDA